VWAEGDDTKRALVIRETIARGRHEGPPKSGRERTVALSRRLRGLLREFSIARGRPSLGERVLPGFHAGNYQRRHFEPVCTAAGLPRHTPKDLRDTFASQLLTAGVQLGYISTQLGHADVATTARHYARWTVDGSYRRALAVEPGEVPADLIARMELEGAAEGSPQFSPHLEQAGKSE
jgi:integrase